MSDAAPSALDLKCIDNKYEIHNTQELGRGTWSVVKRCTPIPPYYPANTRPKMKFVVKIMDKNHLAEMANGDMNRAIAEVKRELDILRYIPKHPNIVPFIEYFEKNKYFLLIFEESPSGDLCDLILNRTSQGESIGEEMGKWYIYQLIMAVMHCHTYNTAHRDVKPENVLVGSNDEIQLSDFGLAKRVNKTTPPTPNDILLGDSLDENEDQDNSLSAEKLAFPFHFLNKKYCKCTDVIGTHRYGAPETFHAKLTHSTYDGFLSDTWAVGVVAYIVLTGSFPFSAGSNASDNDMYNIIMTTHLTFPSYVSQHAKSLIRGLLMKDPEKRLRLSEAADHIWFSSITRKLEKGSTVLKKLDIANSNEDNYNKEIMLNIVNQVNEEVIALHQATQLLRTELLKTKMDNASKLEVLLSTRSNKPALTSSSPTTIAPGATNRGVSSVRTITPSIHDSRQTVLATSTAGVRRTQRSQTPNVRVIGMLDDGVMVAPSTSSAIDCKAGSSRLAKGNELLLSNTPRSATPKRGVLKPSPVSSLLGVSPLSRANPATVRRGTPMQMRGVTPFRSPVTSSSASSRQTLNSTRLPTPLRGRIKPPMGSQIHAHIPHISSSSNISSDNGNSLVGHNRSPSTSRVQRTALAAGAAGFTGSNEDVNGSSESLSSNGVGHGLLSPVGKKRGMILELHVGDNVSYHGYRAKIRYMGSTGFGSGKWLGVEMLEGSAGMNDGTNTVDKKRYFVCPKGKGLFVRPNQVDIL